MTRTTTYVEPPFFEYSLPAWCFWRKYTTSFLPSTILFFFDIMLTHIPCHKSSSCWSPSFLVPFPLPSCQSIWYRLSISFFLYSIHIYISTYLWYLRICEKNSPFFWYTKIPHTHCIFFLNHHIFKYCFHFLRLNNVLPSFFLHHELFLLFFLLVSSASSASFFWRSHTLLAFFCFLLVDWYQSTLLFLKLFAWTSVYHHTHHTTSWLRSSGLFLYFT